MTINIGGLDAAIVVAYMLAVLVFGVWLGRGRQSATRYFLGDRSLPWGALLLSIVATETSTVTFLSLPGLAAAAGGNLTVKQETRLVKEADDLELAELMAKLSKKQMGDSDDSGASGSESESESESDD